MTQVEWRVVPTIIEETRPFWEACTRHELVLQHCLACGSYQHYPRPFCGECHGSELEWYECSGKGEVYTFSVTYRNLSPEFKERTPYILAYVELEEGVRVLTNILCCEPEDVYVGMPVEVMFEDVSEQISIPCFRPRLADV